MLFMFISLLLYLLSRTNFALMLKPFNILKLYSGLNSLTIAILDLQIILLKRADILIEKRFHNLNYLAVVGFYFSEIFVMKRS